MHVMVKLFLLKDADSFFEDVEPFADLKNFH